MHFDCNWSWLKLNATYSAASKAYIHPIKLETDKFAEQKMTVISVLCNFNKMIQIIIATKLSLDSPAISIGNVVKCETTIPKLGWLKIDTANSTNFTINCSIVVAFYEIIWLICDSRLESVHCTSVQCERWCPDSFNFNLLFN